MTRAQREAVVHQLRVAPAGTAGTLAEMRASFETTFGSRQLADGVTVGESRLGGRPALSVTVNGAGTEQVILYLHGGGYVIGSARTGLHLAASLAKESGTQAISLDYRLAPEHPFPAAVDDAVAAYKELLDNRHSPHQIALAGDSAGGGLALATLLALRDAQLPQPAAAVVFSPWTDLTLTGASVDTRDEDDPLFTRTALAGLASQYLADRHPHTPLASPLYADLTGLPPLLIQVGSYEVLLDDALHLAVRAAEHDVDVSLDVVAGAPHVFQSNAGSGVLEEADEAIERAGRFLARRLAKPGQ